MTLNGTGDGMGAGDETEWEIIYLDRVDADAQAAFRFIEPFVGREKATEWLRGFYDKTAQRVNFPGPFAHPADAEVSRLTGRNVRKMLYQGGTRQKPIGAMKPIKRRENRAHKAKLLPLRPPNPPKHPLDNARPRKCARRR